MEEQEQTTTRVHSRNWAEFSVEGDGPWKIHGVVLGEDDVTRVRTRDGRIVRLRWTREALKPASSSLKERPLVVDHMNSTDGVVGQVTRTGYREGTLFEAELGDEEIADKVQNGWLEVSARVMHPPVRDLEKVEDGDGREDPPLYEVDEARYNNLSIVPVGEAPSNKVNFGPASQFTESDVMETLDEVEAEETQEQLEETIDNYDIVDLEELAVHVPKWLGRREDWIDGRIRKSDFTTDDLGEIGKHFLISKSGFPPDKYNDLKLPVVDPQNQLSADALDAAKRAASQVEDVEEMEATRIQTLANALLVTEFDKDYVSGELEDALDEWMEESELQDISVHEPDFSGTTEGSWDEPNMEDFDTDDLSEIADHFIVSKTGFPPENFGELSLPVVEPSGELNLNALQNAKARAGQVSGVSSDDEDRINSLINGLANENFDADFGDEEDSENSETETMSEETDETEDGFTIEDEEELAEMAQRAAEADRLENKVEDLEETVEDLNETIDEKDDVIDEFKSDYAEELAEHTPFDEEELLEKFSVEELQEKAEEIDVAPTGSGEGEPRSKDEDETETETEMDDETEAELEKLREQKAKFENSGWDAAASELEDKIEALEE